MLRLKRKKLNLKQTDAAQILGISKSYLSKIENKKRTNLDSDLILKLCILYKISIEELKYFLSN